LRKGGARCPVLTSSCCKLIGSYSLSAVVGSVRVISANIRELRTTYERNSSNISQCTVGVLPDLRQPRSLDLHPSSPIWHCSCGENTGKWGRTTQTKSCTDSKVGRYKDKRPLFSTAANSPFFRFLPFKSMASTGGLVLIRNTGSEGEGASRGNTRVRSRVACRACNHRKVRCDVTRTGIPCSNCLHEGGTCEVLPRKKHR
jgi:hypothetical protein